MILVGQVGGVEIKFDFTPPNTFKAEIPKQLNGTYIVQLQAIDDAGNITGYSNIFIKIDFSSMRVKIFDNNYRHLDESKNFTFREIDFDDIREIDFSYECKELTSQYIVRELIL